MAAADASGAAQSRRRSRVVARALLHAAHVVGFVVLLRALAELPWAAAAAPSVLRVAASFLSPQRVCFIVANGIVIALATLFPRDAASSWPTFAGDASSASPSPGSTSSNGDGAPEQHPLLKFLEASRTTRQQTTEAEPSGEVVVFEDKEAVHVQTVRAEAQPPRRTTSSEKSGGSGAADKETVRVKTARAQPPRRTMSDKTGGGVAAAGSGCTSTAAAPELRRAKSENARRRQRRSASAAAAAAQAELVTDDAEAFRLLVETFIAKQQTLFREESLVVARAAGSGAGGKDGPALAGAAAAAVAVK